MTEKEARTAPLNEVLGYIVRNDFLECQCNCRKEMWEANGETWAQEHEKKCRETGVYDTCPMRTAWDRVMEALKAGEAMIEMSKVYNNAIAASRRGEHHED